MVYHGYDLSSITVFGNAIMQSCFAECHTHTQWHNIHTHTHTHAHTGESFRSTPSMHISLQSSLSGNTIYIYNTVENKGYPFTEDKRAKVYT